MNTLFEHFELLGKTMTMATNDRHSNIFKTDGMTVTFGEHNKAVVSTGHSLQDTEGEWDISTGALALIQQQVPLIFDSKEVRNGCVYAVHSWHEGRIILYEKKLLDVSKLGICVSSHAQFADTAIPKLMKSVAASSFPPSKVVIIVGDSKTNDFSVHPSGAKLIETQKNLLGFTALSEAHELQGADYWLLLHDTCDVLPDFQKQIGAVDVGLNPDIVTFVKTEQRLEIGLYSNKFVHSARVGEIRGKSYEHMAEVHRQANIILDTENAIKYLPPRDIYGEGVKRETVVFPSLGVRKFRGDSISGGRP